MDMKFFGLGKNALLIICTKLDYTLHCYTSHCVIVGIVSNIVALLGDECYAKH